MFKPIILLDLTTEESEKLLPCSKGQWKSFKIPLLKSDNIKPIIIDMNDVKRFTFQVPKEKGK